jgi:hypothetical protein
VSTLVASDLDRTLIYSRKARALGVDAADAICVEVHDGKDASFMTAVAAEELTALTAEAVFVPVTTRIFEQYRRVGLPGRAPAYAVVANGGTLLVDGTPDPSWSRQVEKALADAFPLHAVWEQVGHVCHPEFTVKLRNAADLFCYAVVHPNRLPPGFVEDIAGWAAERGWSTSLQGRKLYWVPTALTKSAAIAEVARRTGCERVVAAGDSILDVDLLMAADRAIHPRHGELYDQGWSAPTVERTDAGGILAGEQIVAWFRRQITPA